MVNKVKLLYNTYTVVAGSGQVDSGVSVDFESEGIYGAGQLSAICMLRGPLGPTEKDGFACLYYYYYCINIITIMIIDY